MVDRKETTAVPKIAVVDGVQLVIHMRDHLPPHLHGVYGEAEIQIAMATSEVLNGSLPRPKLRAVPAWLDANREHVAYIWRDTRDSDRSRDRS